MHDFKLLLLYLKSSIRNIRIRQMSDLDKYLDLFSYCLILFINYHGLNLVSIKVPIFALRYREAKLPNGLSEFIKHEKVFTTLNDRLDSISRNFSFKNKIGCAQTYFSYIRKQMVNVGKLKCFPIHLSILVFKNPSLTLKQHIITTAIRIKRITLYCYLLYDFFLPHLRPMLCHG